MKTPDDWLCRLQHWPMHFPILSTHGCTQGVSVAPSECRLLFVSGQLGFDPSSSSSSSSSSGDLVEGGVAAETKRTLENIEAIVEAAGGTAR